MTTVPPLYSVPWILSVVPTLKRLAGRPTHLAHPPLTVLLRLPLVMRLRTTAMARKQASLKGFRTVHPLQPLPGLFILPPSIRQRRRFQDRSAPALLTPLFNNNSRLSSSSSSNSSNNSNNSRPNNSNNSSTATLATALADTICLAWAFLALACSADSRTATKSPTSPEYVLIVLSNRPGRAHITINNKTGVQPSAYAFAGSSITRQLLRRGSYCSPHCV
jgi:hypothetical protein